MKLIHILVVLVLCAFTASACTQPIEPRKLPATLPEAEMPASQLQVVDEAIPTTPTVKKLAEVPSVKNLEESLSNKKVSRDAERIAHSFVEARGKGDYEVMRRFMTPKLCELWVEGDVRFTAKSYSLKLVNSSDQRVEYVLIYQLIKEENSAGQTRRLSKAESYKLTLAKDSGKWLVDTPSEVDCLVLIDR